MQVTKLPSLDATVSSGAPSNPRGNVPKCLRPDLRRGGNKEGGEEREREREREREERERGGRARIADSADLTNVFAFKEMKCE